MAESKPLKMVTATEEAEISRNVLMWLNSYPDIPQSIEAVKYEYLAADSPAMALSTIQGTYITKRYLLGGHEAEYQFKVIYRIKPGKSINARLDADETLNFMGDWMVEHLPNLGEGIRAIQVKSTTRSSIFAAYENGDEDHQILMKLTYEVNV